MPSSDVTPFPATASMASNITSICSGRIMFTASRASLPSAMYAATRNPVKVLSWSVVSSDASAVSASKAGISARIPWFFPGVDPHLSDAQVAPCPVVHVFPDLPHWYRRLVMAVTVASQIVVELILQLLAHVDGSFLYRGNPLLCHGNFRPQLVGRRHLRVLNLAHKCGQRRERHLLIGGRRQPTATCVRRVPDPSARRGAATSSSRNASTTGRRCAAATVRCPRAPPRRCSPTTSSCRRHLVTRKLNACPSIVGRKKRGGGKRGSNIYIYEGISICIVGGWV